MPGSTGAPWNLDYPLATEAPNGPAAVQGLAEDTAAALGKAYPCLSSARPAHAAGRIIFETDTLLHYISDGANWLALAYGDDTGWLDAVAQGWTAAANFTLASGQCRRKNGLVGVYLTLVTANVIGSGDSTNVSMVTAPSGFIPATPIGYLGGGANASGHTSYINAAGTIVMASTFSGFSAGATFNVTGTYML